MHHWDRASAKWLLAIVFLATLAAGQGRGADSTTATSVAAEAHKAALDRILAGATPMGIADLRAMQEQVRKLTDQLMKTTVGVTVGQAQGSGVIISKDGYVLTAAHVAGKHAQDVTFILADGRELKGKTLGLNRTMDAGLMKIDSVDDLPFAELGSSDQIKLGQWCLATGHPGGYQRDRKPVLRLGRVQWSVPSAITTDCTLVGGDSGGPLFDLHGKVIGINSRIATDLKANMHVPVGTFKDTWERLTKSEEWGHYPGSEPFIGVRGEPEATNAKIATVFPDSPAATAGLKPGDVVVKIDDLDLTDFRSLSAAIGQHHPGDKVKLVIQRGEETKEITLTIGKKDS